MVTAQIFAQNIQVTGTVTDASTGDVVPFASIQIKGTSSGEATDDLGNYSISMPPNGVLVFSFMGYVTQEVPVNRRGVINVLLEPDAEALDDVIIVAYGTATKEAFTGSASVMDAKSIEKRQVSNISNALAGTVAGIQAYSNSGQPGSGSTIRIRGIGSMSASNAPLYVVDGVPFDGNLNSINTRDIASMTVLKDAASSAIYGARGANGVILITTKKGTSRDAVITVDAKWGNNSRAVPSYDVMTSPGQYYETFFASLYNSQMNREGGTPESAYAHANMKFIDQEEGGLGYQVFTIPDGEYLIGTNGKLNPNATLGYSDGDYYYTPDNWYDELYLKENLRQEYNVSISGMTDKMNYFLSFGYLGDTGIIPNSGFSRFSTRTKVDYQAKKWLKVGANFSYTNSTSKDPSNQTEWGSSANLFYVANSMSPIYPLYARDTDKNIIIDSHGYTVYDYGDGSSTNSTRAFMNMSNPGSMLELDKNQSTSDVFGGRAFMNIDIFKGLQFRANVGTDVRSTRTSRSYNPYYGQYSEVGGINALTSSRNASINQQYILSYANKFGKHNFDLIAGYENYNYKYQSLYGSKEKIFNPWIVEVSNGIMNPNTSSSTDTYATEGILARAQYDYDSKYFLSVSYRRDASSRFAPENRWGNFGSIGAAWILNKESFLSSVKWINLLKLKASYGVQGNDKLLYADGYQNYYPYLDQYALSNNNDSFATTLDYKGNQDITWETSYNLNVGVEFSLFDDIFSGSIEYFNRNTKDLLYYQPVAPSNGYSTIPMNIGSITNSGVELDFGVNIIRKENLFWSVNLNMTHYKNTITELDKSVPETGIIDGSVIYQVGGSLYNRYFREFAGINDIGQSQWYIVDKDTKEKSFTTEWSEATLQDVGSFLPKLYGGFGTQFEAYGIDLSLALSFQLGGRIFDGTYQDIMHVNDAGRNWHRDISNAWTPNNTSTDVPRLDALDKNVTSSSTRWVVSSNYLSLNNITLGYTFPAKWTEKIKIGSIRVYASGDNLGLISARQGLDPRQSLAGTAGSYMYTAMRTISGGIVVTF